MWAQVGPEVPKYQYWVELYGVELAETGDSWLRGEVYHFVQTKGQSKVWEGSASVADGEWSFVLGTFVPVLGETPEKIEFSFGVFDEDSLTPDDPLISETHVSWPVNQLEFSGYSENLRQVAYKTYQVDEQNKVFFKVIRELKIP